MDDPCVKVVRGLRCKCVHDCLQSQWFLQQPQGPTTEAAIARLVFQSNYSHDGTWWSCESWYRLVLFKWALRMLNFFRYLCTLNRYCYREDKRNARDRWKFPRFCDNNWAQVDHGWCRMPRSVTVCTCIMTSFACSHKRITLKMYIPVCYYVIFVFMP